MNNTVSCLGRRAIAGIKMADYFSSKKSINPIMNVSVEESEIEEKNRSLERNVIDNIERNFMYAEGEKLQNSLIDHERTISLV